MGFRVSNLGFRVQGFGFRVGVHRLSLFLGFMGRCVFFGWVSRAVLILRYDKDVGARFIARFSTGLLSNQGEKT